MCVWRRQCGGEVKPFITSEWPKVSKGRPEGRPKPLRFIVPIDFYIERISSYDFGVIQTMRDYNHLFYYYDT